MTGGGSAGESREMTLDLIVIVLFLINIVLNTVNAWIARTRNNKGYIFYIFSSICWCLALALKVISMRGI